MRMRETWPEASYSPWGGIQELTRHEHGIFRVSTASHGGWYVPEPWLSEMPEPYRNAGLAFGRFNGWGISNPTVPFSNRADAADFNPTIGAWFEEDCGWAFVYASFPDLADARMTYATADGTWTTRHQDALRLIRSWYPDRWEAATGEHVPDAESHARQWAIRFAEYAAAHPNE
jgi:hypothetical protein